MTVRGLLPRPLCPERTFAFVAGVEQYAISPGWNLRGAARDALRFAGWLTGPAGVPPGNVRLLLSPLQPDALDWSATDGLRALHRTVRPATEENVKNALQVELPSCDGDLLWIFWAGHGFLGANREMLLPCADAHEGQIRHLNLESMLGWWRTDRVKGHRFPLQAALVDACRVDAGRDGRLNFGGNDYGGGTTQVGRRQFRLYAARPGETAKNDAERAAGQFTDALLGELGQRALPDGVDELARIGRSLHRRFQDMRDRGEGWQLPQFVVDRGWDECSFLDDDQFPAPGAARLDQAAWDGIGALFGDRLLPRCAYDAYAWAFTVADCTTPVRGGLPGDTLLDVAKDLDDRQGGRVDVPLVVPFVRFLADRCGQDDPEWAAGLRAWVDTTRERLSVPPLPPPPPAPRTTVLHLRLDPAATDDDRYLVRIWLRRAVTEAIWESEGRPLSLDEVREELVRQLAYVARTLNGPDAGGDAYPAVTRLEFHVPFELLETDFDQWAVPRARRTRPLGMLYEVVVRCPEERRGDHAAWEQWQHKWRWLRTQGGRHERAVRVVEDEQVTDVLGVDLGADAAPACVVADTSPDRTSDVLDAVLEGGVPVAVWRRPGAPEADIPALLPPEGVGLDGLDVLALPRRILELRRAGASGIGRQGCGDGRLALLWDDPEYPMETRSLA
ncbi:hypothetical protein ABZO31_28630 [Streptomyces sp. HUAS MG47]|uniref:VMAP-C domain-containing protein n=1 Tax=Streptomyces solicamelliae TaxID=3231716 RepID=UPI003877C271